MNSAELSTGWTTNWSLLLAAERSNQPAWDQISHIYSPLVYDWLRRAGTPSRDALDLCQNVFVNVFLGLPKFREQGGRFRSWLWIITKRTAIDAYRRDRKQPCTLDPDDWERIEMRFASLGDPPDATASKIPDGVLARALELVQNQFQPRTYDMFYRLIFDDQDPTAVAAAFDVTVNSVYKAKSRVLGALRELLSGLES
jgi:RNA polymerase sigma factor (sigma-70 family)